MPEPTDAAVEQVVKCSGDRDALLAATGNSEPPPVVHGLHGGSVWRTGGRDIHIAPCGADSPLMTMTGLYVAINCPGCLEALSNDETDADPKPRDGEHGTCATCGGEIHYWEYTRWNGVEDDVLDAHWSHVEHPADGHDAEIGGPA